MNIPLVAKFLEHFLDNTIEKEKTIEASILYTFFNNFIQENKFKCEMSSTKFGIELKSYEGIEKRKSCKMIITINKNILQQYLITKYKIVFNNNTIN
jgi:hypothetical protein